MSDDKDRISEYIPMLGSEEIEAVSEVINDGWLSPKGQRVKDLERKICQFAGTNYSTATDSGTAALHLSVESLDLSSEDEVIIPDFTYGSTGLAVTNSRVKPVIVDSERSYLGIDPEIIKNKISPNTKAIIVTHMLGNVADMRAIKEIAEDHNLFLIEDAAQSMGASFQGNPAGSIGDIGCFSFAWSKNITTGKGGAAITDRPGLAEKIEKISDYGRNPEKRFSFEENVGYNYKIDNIRAAIGLIQLNKFREIVDRKNKIFSYYKKELDPIPQIQFPPNEKRRNSESVPSMFALFVQDRDSLHTCLKKNNIDARPFFPPLHEMPAFSKYAEEEYPVTEDITSKGVILPSHPGLRRRDIEKVVRSIKDFYGKQSTE